MSKWFHTSVITVKMFIKKTIRFGCKLWVLVSNEGYLLNCEPHEQTSKSNCKNKEKSWARELKT